MSRVIKQARHLRQAATDAEKILWQRLRNRQVAGLKFRRQQPIGSRIVDFYYAKMRLAVELDGSGHAYDCRRKLDILRAEELETTGVRILRFWNSAIFENLDGVLNAIIFAADPERSLWPPSRRSAGPHLNPLPQGEEVHLSPGEREARTRADFSK